MADIENSARRDAVVIGLVGAAHFLSHFFQLALAPLFPLIKDEFDVSYTALGLIVTVFYVVSGVCQALVGVLVDRFGATRMLLLGLGLLAAAVGLTGMAPNYVSLLPLAALAGIGNSVFHPADLSILSLKVSKPRLGRAYGVHAFCGTAGYAVSPVVIGTIGAFAGWRTALIVAGLLGLAALALMARFADRLKTEPSRGEGERSAAAVAYGYGRLMATPAIMMAFAYFALSAAAGTAVQTYSVSSLVELYEVALPLATTALTLYLGLSALGILLGGVAADRTTRHHRIVILGLGIGATSMAAIGWLLPPFAVVLAMIGAAGLCVGMTAPSRDLIVRGATPPGATGKVFGFVYSGLDIGSSVAPVAFGWLIDNGMPKAIFVLIGVVLIVTIATAMQVRQQPQLSTAD
jgi:MFS family permease